MAASSLMAAVAPRTLVGAVRTVFAPIAQQFLLDALSVGLALKVVLGGADEPALFVELHIGRHPVAVDVLKAVGLKYKSEAMKR